MRSFKNIKNEKGSLTVDFVFALILVLSITFILLGFSFTLSTIESIQYLAYSTSRDYFAGHINKDKQEKLAESKFDELKKTGSYAILLRKDWFDVKYVGSSDFSADYGASAVNKDIFEGTKLQVTVGFLEFNIPLFGSTESDSGGYKANVTSFLGREPTSDECMSMVRRRFEEILAIDNYNTGSMNSQDYVAFDDNGC